MKALKRKAAKALMTAGGKLQCVWGWEVTIELPELVQATIVRFGEDVYDLGAKVYNSTCGDGK